MIRPQFHEETAVAAGHCVQSLIANPTMRKATKYIDPKIVVKATRQRGNKPYARADSKRRETFLVTIGRPNYEEREFIKDCAAADVMIPLGRVQLKAYPKRRK